MRVIPEFNDGGKAVSTAELQARLGREEGVPTPTRLRTGTLFTVDLYTTTGPRRELIVAKDLEAAVGVVKLGWRNVKIHSISQSSETVWIDGNTI